MSEQERVHPQDPAEGADDASGTGDDEREVRSGQSHGGETGGGHTGMGPGPTGS